MVFELTQIKKIRKQLGLTQHAFAKLAGISQSMVAKIESGKLDPTYSKVRQIESALAGLIQRQEQQAKEIMTRKVVVVHPEDAVGRVIGVIKKYGISQVPVMQGEKVLGIVYESSFLRQDIEKLPSLKVEEVMEEAPPTIAATTSLSVIRQMLQWYACVLVSDKGKLRGIITRADVIKSFGNVF